MVRRGRVHLWLADGDWRLTANDGTAHPYVFSVRGYDVNVQETTGAPWLAVDLSAGSGAANYPVRGLWRMPEGGWEESRRLDLLTLRRVEAGTFVMGSPSSEYLRDADEVQHEVTLTQPYYMGIYELTQKQWQDVMGNRPSYFSTDWEKRPVEQVSYDTMRGTSAGSRWPTDDEVDSSSFLGQLRSKTGVRFDLPTEAQWEYAARAGMVSSLSNGREVTATNASGSTIVMAINFEPRALSCPVALDGQLGRVWRGEVKADRIDLPPNECALFEVLRAK